MYLLILIIPFVNFLLLITLGRFLGSRFISLLLFNLFVLFFVAFSLFYEVVFLIITCLVPVGDWFSVGLGTAS